MAVSARVFPIDVYAVEAVGGEHGGDVAGVEGARFFSGSSLAEASGVAPAADGDHDLCVGVEAGTHGRDGFERGISASWTGGEEGGAGEGHDYRVDTGSYYIVW